MVEDAPKREVPAQLRSHLFQPGQPKRGGRRKLTPNRDRTLTVNRIVRLADPIGVLCDIASGKRMRAAAEPGSAVAVDAYPTMADRLMALKVLADKVLPDLKAVSVEDGSALVNVVLQFGQKVVVAPTEALDR